MDHQFTEREVRSFKNAFSLFDKNHDGKITNKELEGALKFLGKNPSEYNVEIVMKDLDEYGNGTIEFPEFLQLLSQKLNNNQPNFDEINEVFRVFDKDGDGFITTEEIQQEMGNHGDVFTEEQVKEMIKGADTNGDGKIDYEEFVKLMQAST